MRIIFVVVFLLLLLIGGGVVFFLFRNNISLPGVSNSGAKPKVTVASGNRNPFAKKSQYVNPFNPTKNAFANFNEQ